VSAGAVPAVTTEARALVEHWIYDSEMPRVACWDEQLATERAERAAATRAVEEERLRRKEAEECRAANQKRSE
jgi:hypothetical protein